jgi:hypothetical protein
MSFTFWGVFVFKYGKTFDDIKIRMETPIYHNPVEALERSRELNGDFERRAAGKLPEGESVVAEMRWLKNLEAVRPGNVIEFRKRA